MRDNRKMARDLAFGLTTPRDFLEKARRDVRRLRQRPLAIMVGYNDQHETIDQAINAAVTLWHVTDWLANSPPPAAFIQHAKQASGTAKTNTYGVLRDFALKNHDLAICHDLANGSKHLELDNPQATQSPGPIAPTSSGSSQGMAAVTSAPPPYERFVAKVVMPNGDRVPVLEVYDRALAYWDNLFTTHNL